jgi:hypothetical protein
VHDLSTQVVNPTVAFAASGAGNGLELLDVVPVGGGSSGSAIVTGITVAAFVG